MEAITSEDVKYFPGQHAVFTAVGPPPALLSDAEHETLSTRSSLRALWFRCIHVDAERAGLTLSGTDQLIIGAQRVQPQTFLAAFHCVPRVHPPPPEPVSWERFRDSSIGALRWHTCYANAVVTWWSTDPSVDMSETPAGEHGGRCAQFAPFLFDAARHLPRAPDALLEECSQQRWFDVVLCRHLPWVAFRRLLLDLMHTHVRPTSADPKSWPEGLPEGLQGSPRRYLCARCACVVRCALVLVPRVPGYTAAYKRDAHRLCGWRADGPDPEHEWIIRAYALRAPLPPPPGLAPPDRTATPAPAPPSPSRGTAATAPPAPPIDGPGVPSSAPVPPDAALAPSSVPDAAATSDSVETQ